MGRKEHMAKPKNIVVEVQLRDGWLSMYVGKLVKRTEKFIILTDAAWVGSTGRRHLFFAGTPDANVEIEPYPAGMTIELPAELSIVTDWPHPLPREAR